MWLRAQSKAGGCQSSQEKLDIVMGADGIIATERWWVGIFLLDRERSLPPRFRAVMRVGHVWNM